MIMLKIVILIVVSEKNVVGTVWYNSVVPILTMIAYNKYSL